MQPDFLSGYFGRPLHDLYHLFLDQVSDLYEDFGLDIPVVCSSTLQLIYEKDQIAPADIARALNDPHQVVAQRLASLSKRQMIQKKGDPEDRRRTVISLTERGKNQARLLEHLMAVSQPVYSELGDEIGADVPAILKQVQSALQTTDLRSRMLKHDPTLAKQTAEVDR